MYLYYITMADCVSFRCNIHVYFFINNKPNFIWDGSLPSYLKKKKIQTCFPDSFSARCDCHGSGKCNWSGSLLEISSTFLFLEMWNAPPSFSLWNSAVETGGGDHWDGRPALRVADKNKNNPRALMNLWNQLHLVWEKNKLIFV